MRRATLPNYLCAREAVFAHSRSLLTVCTDCEEPRMKVLIDDLFAGISCAEYEALYFDEEFNRTVGRELRMGRRLLRFERTDSRIQRKVQYEPERDPDSPAGQAFGTSRASFIEELDY